jgi:UDP:flavonoid glycosyltransferase YjiC (YdhE family)
MFSPDKMILDYSPTVTLAARIAKIPCVLIGNGFELPPMTDPLPPFPGFSWATPEKAAQSERLAVTNANGVLGIFHSPPIVALRELVIDGTRLFVTLPDLDHYGERADAQYIGPLLGKLHAPRVDWPVGQGPKIFACLRPDTSYVHGILSALAAMTARVVCSATGFTKAQLEPYRGNHIRFALVPVELQPLVDADLCITYGAEGTMMTFLMAGVPQLIVPWHVEAFLMARRIEAKGLGSTIAGVLVDQAASRTIEHLASNVLLRKTADAFAARMVEREPTQSVLAVA